MLLKLKLWLFITFLTIHSFGQEVGSVVSKPDRYRLLSHVDISNSTNDDAFFRMSVSIATNLIGPNTLGIKAETMIFTDGYMGFGANYKHYFSNNLKNLFFELDLLAIRKEYKVYESYMFGYKYKKTIIDWGSKGVVFLGFSHKIASQKLSFDFKYGIGYQNSIWGDGISIYANYNQNLKKEVRLIKYFSFGVSYYFNDLK